MTLTSVMAVILRYFTQFCSFHGPLRKVAEDHKYFMRLKCKSKESSFSGISYMAIFAGITSSEGVKVRHSPFASEI